MDYIKNKMNKYFLIAGLFFYFFNLNLFAQKSDLLENCMTVEDSAQFIRHILVDNKHNFIGKKADVVFKAYSEYLPVRCTIPCESSPFVDPEGKSYISGVQIYYKDFWTIDADFDGDVKYFYIHVKLEDTHVDADFWRRLPKDDKRHLYHLRNFIVKDVKLILVDPKSLKVRGNL